MHKYTIEVIWGEIDGKPLRYSSEAKAPDTLAAIYLAVINDSTLEKILLDSSVPLLTISVMKHKP